MWDLLVICGCSHDSSAPSCGDGADEPQLDAVPKQNPYAVCMLWVPGTCPLQVLDWSEAHGLRWAEHRLIMPLHAQVQVGQGAPAACHRRGQPRPGHPHSGPGGQLRPAPAAAGLCASYWTYRTCGTWRLGPLVHHSGAGRLCGVLCCVLIAVGHVSLCQPLSQIRYRCLGAADTLGSGYTRQ